MRARAYYNEIDLFAADWLRNLIAEGLIPAGDVDTRSIADVAADDLVGYAQCHFFAGIGGWALAARLAGWPEERELWTGSCPCQPFSVAGKGAGTNDERHLWPHQLRLIRACRPAVWMGEQVAAAVGKDWLDGVLFDLEGIGYAGRAAVVPACAVDGPHRRDRLWIVADGSCVVGDSQRPRLEGHAGHGSDADGWAQPGGSTTTAGCGGAVGHADQLGASEGRQQRGGQLGWAGFDPRACDGLLADADHDGRIARCRDDSPTGHRDSASAARGAGDGCAVADACSERRQQESSGAHGDEGAHEGRPPQHHHLASSHGESRWAGAAWIIDHDGKARRVEPGIRLLAHGVPARVGRLRAYGNAIVPQVAAEVIGAYLDVLGAA